MADESSLSDDVWRKQTLGPSGPTAVSHILARTPREGTEIAAAPGRRNLAHAPLTLGDVEKCLSCTKLPAKEALNAGDVRRNGTSFAS